MIIYTRYNKSCYQHFTEDFYGIKNCSTIKYDPTTYDLAKSMNTNHCVTPDTQIIIVGTITPPAGNGYFYTAPRNKIYGYIDAARGTNLKELKNKLTTATSSTSIIASIKHELMKEHIAFLDVFEEVIRKKSSCYDKDIIYATLDCTAFKTAFSSLKTQKVKVICNSQLAYQCYNKIKADLDGTITLPSSTLLSQRYGKKDDWLNALK